jgi:hypothetical protein
MTAGDDRNHVGPNNSDGNDNNPCRRQFASLSVWRSTP